MDYSRKRPRILIAGLGNVLLRDDGVGVHAVRELQEAHPRGVLAVEVGAAVLDALHLFQWADRILAVDAMRAGGPPGTIYSFRVEDVKEDGPQASLHELSLLAAFRFLPDGRRPGVMILGVEPAIIDYGLDLSPAVQAALPGLVQAAKDLIARWRGESIRSESAGDRNPMKRIGETFLRGGSAAKAG